MTATNEQQVTTENSPDTLGTMIEQLAELRDRKRDLNSQIKDIEDEFNELQLRVMSALDTIGCSLTRSGPFTVSITESEVPDVTDWDAFHGYILEEGALYLLDRRASVKAWREMYESGVTVPGTQPFTKRSLNLRRT